MNFDRKYFENEIREGFLVPTPMKHAWAAQLEVLEVFDTFCKKHEITYFADWGTLLGAVRHNGFIPWDDDIDVSMTRKNYRKFLEIAKEELPEGYHIVNFYSDNGFTYYLTRFVNSYEINLSTDFMKKFHGFPYVAGLDIFVVDYIAPDEKRDKEQVQLIKEITNHINCLQKLLDESGMELEKADSVLKEQRNPTYINNQDYLISIQNKYHVNIQESIPLIRKLYILCDEVMALYSDDEKYPNPEKITLMPYWVDYHAYDFRADIFDTLTEVPFENMMLPAPFDFDEVLKVEYGDYWVMDRKGNAAHNYPFYAEQEKILWEKLQTSGEWCIFSESVWVEKEKKNRRSVQKIAAEYYSVLQRFMQMLVKISGERNYEVLWQLLAKGQDLAVQLGDFLESIIWSGYRKEDFFTDHPTRKKNCEEIVRNAVIELENYCEYLYEISNCLTEYGQKDAEPVSEEQLLTLHSRLEQILLSMQGCLPDVWNEIEKLFAVKRILFVIRTLEDMKSCIKAAERYRDKDDYLLQFLFVETYERLPDGKRMDAYIKDIEQVGGPEFLNPECYSPYEQLPDEIYVFDPFDNCNPDYTVDKKYYSGNLLECTKKLIYVPSLTPLDFEKEDERSVKNLKLYVPMPALIYADAVVVSTDCIRDRYMECLSEWSGEKWQSAWEDKLCTMENWTS